MGLLPIVTVKRVPNHKRLPLPRLLAVGQVSAAVHLQKSRSADRIKRVGDLLISCALLSFTLPLMAIVSLAIKCESSGPVFERQECVGGDGRHFKLLKFRVTVHYPEHSRALRAPNTRLGQFLRYTRIEDLPQLMNVLRGEMSLIDTDAHVLASVD